MVYTSLSGRFSYFSQKYKLRRIKLFISIVKKIFSGNN